MSESQTFKVLSGAPARGVTFPNVPTRCPCCGGKLRDYKWYMDDGDIEFYECAECPAHFGMNGAYSFPVMEAES